MAQVQQVPGGQAGYLTLPMALQIFATPIGGVHITTTPTNPAAVLGYGAWEQFAAGRVLVGLDINDADFDTALETGGSKVAQL
jgi:hypothetical protein